MNSKLIHIIFIFLIPFCFGCVSSNMGVNTSVSVLTIDETIKDVSIYLNNRLPKSNRLLVLNIKSDYPQLSEYIIDSLIENIVNDGLLTIVDRQQLTEIRNELYFQSSGEVSDETAQSIGHMVGAQTIISGNITPIGNFYRLRIRAISVESAEVQGQFNRNISDGPIISALIGKKTSMENNSNSSDQNTKPKENISEEEIMPGLVGEITNGRYVGTTWSDGLTPSSTIIFGNNSLKLTGFYWGNLTGKIYESNLYSNQIQVWTSKNKNEGFELIEYWDGRLIVQGQKPHFFQK
ncbi:MAG: penicillin-binding protein activator LpoB [Bacteroidales bacterium]|nr:penicillin-binding protein activator LpoB [Bacteroidales bacterium]